MFWVGIELIEYIKTGTIGFLLCFFIVCSIFFLIKYYYYKQYYIPDGNYNEPVSIIVSVYKEKPWLLKECLKTVKSKPEDELIIVFDGSNQQLESIAKKYANKLFVLEHTGKRNAISYGINKSSNEIVVTVDSDTFFENDCIDKIIKPFSNNKIGAVSSNQRIFNPGRSLIRTFANLFEIASHDFNQLGESARGHIGCMFGRCVAFRKSVLIPYLEYYNTEKFMGVKCAGSDDRLLTDIVIRQGYKTIIHREAMCYTDCPNTWGSYIKQQRRWQNGSQRSTISRFHWLLSGSKITAVSFILYIILPFWVILVWINAIYSSILGASTWILLPLQTQIFIGCIGAFITWSQRRYYIFKHSKIKNILLWFLWIGVIQVFIAAYSFIEIFIRKDLANQWRTK